MPSIRVELFEGRTVDEKRALATALTEATMRTFNLTADAVDVMFFDVPRHNWASAGVLWSDKAKAAPVPDAAP